MADKIDADIVVVMNATVLNRKTFLVPIQHHRCRRTLATVKNLNGNNPSAIGTIVNPPIRKTDALHLNKLSRMISLI